MSFVELVLKAFKKINDELNDKTLEHDFSPRLGKYFVENVLGYSGNEFIYERSRTDVTILDENHNRVILIETKRPKESLDADKWRDQAGKYADATTNFVGLTNGYRLLIWQVINHVRELKVDIDFKRIIDSKRISTDKLSTKENEQLLFLNNLTKSQIWSNEKYGKFDDYYAIIDVFDEKGFDKLIEQLNYISNNILFNYTHIAFNEYYAGYSQYKQSLKSINELKKANIKNPKKASEIAREELKIDSKFKKYSTFSGYYIWKALSNRPDDEEEENKQIFCKESIYVLLNRLLFIRICEDKGLLKKKISNGGIQNLRDELSEPIIENSDVFKQIIKFSYSGAQKIYYHFYEKDNPLDWYESGNGELDRVLNRVIWILNQFNFTKVDRDILGKIYEKYLPKEERKRLGEFYTPDKVIDYILDAVGYNSSSAIENKSIIDPACGSGGFLVRASRRLIARHVVKFGKASLKEALDNNHWSEIYGKLTPKECEEIINSIATNIYGFDINPFAVNISEMNLLFQIIDLYSKAVKGNSNFIIPRFKIYDTDSLELPTDQTSLSQFQGLIGESLAKDKTSIDELKRKKYDFIVGNPPYVNTSNIENSIQIDYYRKAYSETVFRNFDLYIPFIQLGVKLMANKGRMSYICSNQFMVKEYGKNLRKFLHKNVGIAELIDFEDNKVFDSATNYPLIFIFTKEKTIQTLCAKVLSMSDNIFNEIEAYKKTGKVPTIISMYYLPSNKFTESEWILRPESEQGLIKILHNLPKLASRAEFVSGLRTGKDGAYFGRIENEDQPLFTLTTKLKTVKVEPQIIKPVLKGKDVRKWNANPSIYSIYPHTDSLPYTIPHEIMQKEFPNAINYFKEIKSILDNRKWFKKTAIELHNEFYAMMYFDLPSDFEKAEIVTPALTKEPNFALNEKKALFIGGTAGIIGIIPKMNKYALLGILNSKVFSYYLKTQPIKQGRYRQMSVKSIKDFPIPFENKTIESEIAAKVSQTIKLKAKNGDVSVLESEIDKLVFSFYGLNEENQRLIEKEAKSR